MRFGRICNVDQGNSMSGAVLDVKIILAVVRGREKARAWPGTDRNVRCYFNLVLFGLRLYLFVVLLGGER